MRGWPFALERDPHPPFGHLLPLDAGEGPRLLSCRLSVAVGRMRGWPLALSTHAARLQNAGNRQPTTGNRGKATGNQT
jgi:hypothetical protein